MGTGPIVLMGPSGCGKSLIGSLLQRHIQGVFIEGDDLHSKENIAKMSNGTPLTDEDRQPWLERIHAQLTKTRQNNPIQPVIVACSALKHRYRRILSQPPNGDILFVYLKTPLDVLEERIAGRKNHFIKPGFVKSQLETLEEPMEEEEHCMTIDSTLSVDAIIDKILMKLH